jgi:hypothetical protein
MRESDPNIRDLAISVNSIVQTDPKKIRDGARKFTGTYSPPGDRDPPS